MRGPCEDGEKTDAMSAPDCQDLADRMATCTLEPSKTEKDYVKELVRDGKPVKFDCAGLIEHFPDACYNDGDHQQVRGGVQASDHGLRRVRLEGEARRAVVQRRERGVRAEVRRRDAYRPAAGAVDVDAWWNFQVEGYGTADDTSESHYSSLSTVLADVRGLCPVSCGVCDADAGGSPSGTVQVQAGLGFTETGANMAAGRCLVVHDYDGARIASAPLRPAHDTTPMELD